MLVTTNKTLIAFFKIALISYSNIFKIVYCFRIELIEKKNDNKLSNCLKKDYESIL